MIYFMNKLKTYKFATRATYEELAKLLDTNVATIHRLITNKTGNEFPKKEIFVRFNQIINELRNRSYTQFPSLFLPEIPDMTYVCFDGMDKRWKGFYGGREPVYNMTSPREVVPGQISPFFGVDLSHLKIPAYPEKMQGFFSPDHTHSMVLQTPEGWVETSQFYNRTTPIRNQLFNISLNRHRSISLTKPPRKPRTRKEKSFEV